MLTAFALAVATVLPPISVRVDVGPNIPRAVVVDTLEEAAAIWRPAGVTFEWQIVEQRSDNRTAVVTSVSCCPRTLRVTVNEDSPAVQVSSLPIGWIIFDERGAPRPDIHLSYANALTLVRAAEGVGTMSRMTVLELRTVLSRTLGRALAHELGHYLLASKSHTAAGLMKGSHVASEFLAPQRGTFEIDPGLKAVVEMQLRLPENVARR